MKVPCCGAVGLFVFCLAAAPLPAAAQSGRITGVVVDATGGVLPGASVTLRGGPDGPREVQADASGRYTFTGVAPGIYSVTVFLSGFGAATVEGVAVAGDLVELPAITLRLGAFDDAVVVTATRIEEPLQQVPLSISAVTGADIERRAIGNLTELSRWTPGLTVVDQGPRGSNVVIARGLHTNALAHGGAPGSDAGVTFNLPLVPRKLALRGSIDRFADPGFIDYDYLLRMPGVSAGDLTAQFRSFSAYTREESREERFNWETRLVSTGDGPWRWAGGRWFGYGIRTGSLTEFPYTPMYNSPFTDFESDDRGVLFKASVSYRFDDRTNAYFTRSEGYRIGGGNNFRVCTDEEIALLSDADPGNDPPQSGCIYEDQALIRPDTTTNYELGLRRSWRDGRFSAGGTLFHVDWEDIQVAGLTPFSSEPITLNGGGAALEFLYGYTYIGDVLAPRRVGAGIRYTFG